MQIHRKAEERCLATFISDALFFLLLQSVLLDRGLSFSRGMSENPVKIRIDPNV